MTEKILHGFREISVRECPDIDAVMHIYEHIKCGTRLCHLLRVDECKTFAISFKTIPTDSTGVFHILEHSVLCGSEKFPTKEPFTDMMKSSLNTFLNAMTYPDKTVYPVSSKNDKDFYNLVNVYMDAVLHPLSIKSEEAYRQEGWRYEMDESGRIVYNGVVYSEMKGAYSSPDEVSERYMSTLLFPGGTYSYDSGGDPDYIPDLTFEAYCASHEKYYHPSNAYIVLDGDVKLDEILPLLDSYLSEYDKREDNVTVDLGDEIITEPLTIGYELDREEDPTDKTRLMLGYITGKAEDTTRANAIGTLFDAIADTNTSILKKRILDTGLCSAVAIYPMNGLLYNCLYVEFKNVKDGEVENLKRVFDEALASIIESGIDKKLLSASIDLTEFRIREADYGSYPKGIIFATTILDGVNNGLTAEDTFDYSEEFKALRDRLDTDYYLDILRDIKASKRATLILTPDKSLAASREEKCQREIEERLAALGEDGMEALASDMEHFAIWQARENTPEELATIPKLSLSDLGDEPKEIKSTVYNKDGATVLMHPLSTGGIVYTDLYFDISDATSEDLSLLSLLSGAYSSFDTEYGSANDFSMRAKSTLGECSFSTTTAKNGDDAKVYLLVRFSALKHKLDEALALIEEMLYHKIIDNKTELMRRATQIYLAAGEQLASAGHVYATIRAAARYSLYDTLTEYMRGYEYYKWLGNIVKSGDASFDAVISRGGELLSRALKRERVTIGITGTDTKAFADKLLMIIKSGGSAAGKTPVTLLPRRNEGIIISSQVAHTALGTNIYLCEGAARTGHNALISQIISYNTLWDEVRVRGGAYGTGLSIRHNSGTTNLYSFRDPNPKGTLEIFRTIGERAEEYLSSDFDLESAIISAVGSFFGQVRTPAIEGATLTQEYLAGKTHLDRLELWRSIRYATREELIGAALHLSRVVNEATATVVASRDMLASLGLDELLEL